MAGQKGLLSLWIRRSRKAKGFLAINFLGQERVLFSTTESCEGKLVLKMSLQDEVLNGVRGGG